MFVFPCKALKLTVPKTIVTLLDDSLKRKNDGRYPYDGIAPTMELTFHYY